MTGSLSAGLAQWLAGSRQPTSYVASPGPRSDAPAGWGLCSERRPGAHQPGGLPGLGGRRHAHDRGWDRRPLTYSRCVAVPTALALLSSWAGERALSAAVSQQIGEAGRNDFSPHRALLRCERPAPSRALLGRRPGLPNGRDPYEGIALLPSDVTGFRIRFLSTQEPKAGQNQMHLDLTSTSLEDQQQAHRHWSAPGGGTCGARRPRRRARRARPPALARHTAGRP